MIEEKSTHELAPGADPDPHSPNHAEVVSTNDARSGVTLGRMRWVLLISLLGAVAAVAVIWLGIPGH